MSDLLINTLELTLTQEKEVSRQMELIQRGVMEVIPAEELRQKLRKSVATGVPLHVKLGMDPTAPDLHLGHTVVLQKIRLLQDLGHIAHLVIGDFTGQIGDPTDKTETRKQLTPEKVLENAKTYAQQVFKVLNPERTKLIYNSSWLAPLQFADVLRLAAISTVARMLERDNFAKRFRDNLPIHIHEFFYPLMQAYDSVHLQTDIELGGTDQKFNLLMGRTLQKEFGLPLQVVLIMPLLEGLDGVHKMSKSLGNYIGIDESPEEMFGKVMSLPDSSLRKYHELLSTMSMEDIQNMQGAIQSGTVNPRDIKINLAKELVERFCGNVAANEALVHWERVFQKRDLPEHMPVIEVSKGPHWIVKLLVEIELATSHGEARRLIEQGGVKRNQGKLSDSRAQIMIESGDVFQVGKRRFVRCLLK